MKLLGWKPEFSVGNAAVDHEHRELIDLINNVHAGISEGAGRDQLVSGLGEIYAQIAAHFALEEKMMRNADYVGYAPHKDDHESLLDQLTEIIDAVELEGRYDEHALSSVLNAWFSEHFRTHDAKLHGRL
ncbi:MAG: bacteriohemerythrin [Gammaproteobacteria bacterium]|jgi:hemerythrin-like metal-binding protein|nr:bacteriohemerythrin [Gammaproteobacteria bacterium]